MSARSSMPAVGIVAPRPAEESMSVIDRHSAVDGSLNTSQDLRIEGRVDGTLRCDGVLHVAPGAEIDADVDAAAIIVEGSLSGVVQCRGRLEVRSTGVMRADVETARLVVHEGGRVEGRVMMRTVERAVETEQVAARATSGTAPTAQGMPTERPPASLADTNPPGSPFLRGFPGGRSETPAGDDDLPGAAVEEDEPGP